MELSAKYVGQTMTQPRATRGGKENQVLECWEVLNIFSKI